MDQGFGWRPFTEQQRRPPPWCLARTPLRPAQCRLGHLAQGPSPGVCLPFLFPHLIFSSGLFLFCYLFSLHEMYLEEPSSAEPLSSYCFTVGKTSLITRFMYDSFDNTYQVRSWVPLPSLVSAAMTVAWSPPWPLSRAC